MGSDINNKVELMYLRRACARKKTMMFLMDANNKRNGGPYKARRCDEEEAYNKSLCCG